MQFTLSAAVFGLAALVAAAPAALPAAVVARGAPYGQSSHVSQGSGSNQWGGQGQGGSQWGGQGQGQWGGQGQGQWGGQGQGQWGGQGGQGGQIYCPKGSQQGCYTGAPEEHESTYNDVDVYSSCSGNSQSGLIPLSLCDNLNGNTILPVNLELLNF